MGRQAREGTGLDWALKKKESEHAGYSAKESIQEEAEAAGAAWFCPAGQGCRWQ